ncbi:MAG: sn-glycerol-1-phosphate dehydrogenase [Oscillospiraceae bacterium]|nr:sn-glycerol-1-phosphate dehydrogenase [Oscillospiraceae bacterium]
MIIDSKKYGGLCSCGKDHAMATRLCVIEKGALNRFEDYMQQAGITGKRCAVYAQNTYDIPGFDHPKAEQTVLLDPKGLHADEVSTAKLKELLEPDIEVLIAVGGGTIHDIVRFCAGELEIPFVSVPTAASCDGFCSNVAAMTWYGYKKTVACGAPALVIADVSVIAKAPLYLTATGVGDMLGKFTALADWKMSNIVTDEHLSPVIYDIMNTALLKVWDNCLKLPEGDLEAYEAMTYGLLMSGLAMQMIGSSRPASGGEHHISHFIEVEPAILKASSTALHGEKVAVGTVIASREYHRMAEVEDISDKVVDYAAVSEERLLDIFGEKLFEACRDENAKDCLAPVTPEALTAAWPKMRGIISEIPTGDEIFAKLEKLGAKRTLTDIGIPEDKLSVIIENSPMIRNRLTLMRMRRMIKV